MSNYRLSPDDPGFADCFVRNGFVVCASVLDSDAVTAFGAKAQAAYEAIKAETWSDDMPDEERSTLEPSRDIIERPDIKSELFDLMVQPAFLDALEKFLGPDISVLAWQDLWINDPEDPSPVTNKALHQEYWSGAGPDDLTAWVPLTELDGANGLTVLPGSHTYGVVPNRNRQALAVDGIDYDNALVLHDVAPGDAVLFHSLLLHGTAGKGNRLRLAAAGHFKPTFAETSAKMTSVGQIGVRMGPLTKIRHVLGNDQFTPFRTYGGPVSNVPRSRKD